MLNTADVQPRTGVLRDVGIIVLLAIFAWIFAAAVTDASHLHTSNFLNDQVEYTNVGRNFAATDHLFTNITFPATLWQPFTKNYVYMPGYYFLLGVVYKCFGYSVATSLLPSGLSFLLASAGVYLLGNKLYDRSTGFVAALLFMLFPPILYFSCTAMLELSLLAATVIALTIFVHLPLRLRPIVGPLLLLLPLMFRETALLLVVPMALLMISSRGPSRLKAWGIAFVFGIVCVMLVGIVMRSPLASGRISLWVANLFDPTPHAIYASAVTQKALSATHHNMTGAVIYKLKSNLHFTWLMLKNSLSDADQRYEFFSLFLIAIAMIAALVAGIRKRQFPMLAAGGMTLLMYLALITIYNLHGYRGVRVLLFCVPLLAVAVAHLCVNAKHGRMRSIVLIGFMAIVASLTIATRAECTAREDFAEASDTMVLDALHHDNSRMLVAPYEIATRYAFEHYPVKYSFAPGDIPTLAMLEERFDIGTMICPTTGTEALPQADLLQRGYKFQGFIMSADQQQYAVYTKDTPKFIVLTTGETGFRVGIKEYKIGMLAQDFIEAYGKPEGRYGQELCYYSKGVEFAVNRATDEIGQMTFFSVDKDYTSVGGGKYSAGDFITDRGVKAGDEEKRIIELYGKPTEINDGPPRRTLEYPWGRFYVDNGIMTGIELGNGQF